VHFPEENKSKNITIKQILYFDNKTIGALTNNINKIGNCYNLDTKQNKLVAGLPNFRKGHIHNVVCFDKTIQKQYYEKIISNNNAKL
jgi:protoporphyrinogen oxidase